MPGNSVRRLGLDGSEIGKFGSWSNGLLSWPVGLDVDSTGLVFVTAEQGATTAENQGSVSVFAPDGTFVSRYRGSAIPTTLGVVVGESTSDYVELWALSAASSGSRVVKLIAQKQGGQVDSRHNPAGWVWEVDASFDTGVLGFKAFTMSGDLRRGELYVMPRTGTAMRINAQTGAQLGRIGSVGSRPGSYSLSRGAAADMSGFLHMTTENGYLGVSERPVVQIFAETPSPVTALTASPTPDSVALEWAPLSTGDDTPYGQAPLRAYVVEYRATPDGAWEYLGEDVSPADTQTQVTGLAPEQSYEFRVTPFNEAGSGDPAVIAATTTPLPLPGALTLTKQGDGKPASAEKPAQVAAGATVEFSYHITNTGESPVTGLALTDDKIGPIGLKSELAPGESAVVLVRGTVAVGPYTNVATVRGTTLGEAVSASASWHAVGTKPAPPKTGTTPPTQKLTESGTSGPAAWTIALPLLLLAAGGTAAVVGVRRHRR